MQQSQALNKEIFHDIHSVPKPPDIMSSLRNPYIARAMVAPNTPMETKVGGGGHHSGHCSRACTIALATVIPIVFLILILSIAFLVWGRPHLERRRRAKEEEEATKRKLGDEESVTGGSDVSSFDGQVLRRGEERDTDEIRREEVRRERRVEEGHEHDHVLAMIHARM